MAKDYTTTALLTSIKNRAMIPTSQLTLQDTDILGLATEELWLGVVPFMMKVRSEYFVASSDTVIVAGQNAYPIPSRAMGGKLAYLSVVDDAGNLFPCPEIEKSAALFYTASSAANNTWVFYFEGTDVVLVPTPNTSSGCSLRFSFYSRVGDLVATSAVARVTNVEYGEAVVTLTVDALPSTFIAGAVTIDMINGAPGFNFRAVDQDIAGIGSSTITFLDPPTTLAVGDWLAISGESPVPQVPPELHPLLAQRTAVKVLEALGDTQSMQAAEAKVKTMEESALHLISPRSDQNPKKLNNRYSTLRSQGR